MTNETIRRMKMDNYDMMNDYQTDLENLEQFAAITDYSMNAMNDEGIPMWKTWKGNKYFNETQELVLN